MPKLNIVESVRDALDCEMKKDKSVIVIGEDVGLNGGVFRATDGLYKKYGNKRVIDTPLAESGIVGSAIGMAIAGLKPVAEIQFDGFTYPALDQIFSHAARIRNRTRGRYTCPLVVRFPYGGGIRALEHHNESPETYFAHTPGLKVVIPSNPYDTKGLLIAAIRDPDPVIFMEPKRIYRAVKGEVPSKPYTVEIGKAKIVKEGTDLTLIAWGAMVRECMKVAESLDNVNVEVIDVRTIKPCDYETIFKSVQKTSRAIVVHEAPLTLGFGAEIAAQIQERCLLQMNAPVLRVTGYDVPFPYFKLENEYLPSEERIINAIEMVMNY
ncbi:alpha-ketoacid dehydrogenase subunit beta [Candidatus Woesearchaeota archaeon CG10_big_fil_rev_8_21_14_0_10_37_12]|nr:MAG: alpha-ketoacid dehydrogenase subunit beta [Candidatus Woesearchaeota archaeon CG10_big_fil_rev_8_21_14_0_10_37_12]